MGGIYLFIFLMEPKKKKKMVYDEQDGGQRGTETHKDGGKDDLKLVDYSTDRSIRSQSYQSRTCINQAASSEWPVAASTCTWPSGLQLTPPN